MSGAQATAGKWLDAATRLYVKLRPAILIILLLLLSAGSIFVFLWATQPHGIGVRTDSVEYLWGAENLARGIGLGRLNGLGQFRPMTHWPPLYPVLLALPQFLGMDGLSAARWWGALNIGLMVLLFGLSLSRLTNGSPWYSGLGALVLVASYAFWNTSLYAMTEPLYMVLGLAALLFLDDYLISNKRAWLLASSVFLGLGLLTRYAAGALILASLLVLLIQKGRSFKQKMTDVVVLCLVSILPLAIWTVRNFTLAGTATNRFLELIRIPLEEWLNLRDLVVGWLLPAVKITEVNLPRLLLIVLVTIALAWFTGRARTSAQVNRSQLWIIYFIYAACYVLYILAAKLLFDNTIPLGEERIFFPLFSALVMLIVSGLFQLEKRLAGHPYYRIALVCLYVLLATGFVRGGVQASAAYATLSREKGLGLVNDKVTDLDVIAAIRNLPAGPVIFSDDLEVLYFLTGRPSFQINAVTPDEVRTVKDMMKERGVYIVLFKEFELGEQLVASLPQLEKIYSGSEVIYSGGRQP